MARKVKIVAQRLRLIGRQALIRKSIIRASKQLLAYAKN